MIGPEPEVSVCIANYNGSTVLRACLDSVMGQEPAAPIEVIVHDDASTDNSVQIIESYGQRVSLLRSNQNSGFCISNNRMVSASRGKYILLLNNDAALHPGAVAALHHYADRHAFEGILSLPQFDARTGECLDLGMRFDPFLNPVAIKSKTNKTVGMVMGSCLWVPRTTWDRLGGFPEWFGSIAEDMFLCFAAWNAGYGVRVLDHSGYDHFVGSNFGGGRITDNRLTTTVRRRFLSEQNKTFVMVIFYPFFLLVPMLPIHLASLAAEGFLVALQKRDWRIWRTIYWNVFESLWRHRHTLIAVRNHQKMISRFSLHRFLRLFNFFPYKVTMFLRHGFPDLR